MARSRRSLAREIGNPLTMFHEPRKKGERDVKWSGFRCFLFILIVAFITVIRPTEWNPWSFGALAVLALALPARDFAAMIPMAEAFAALTAWFGGVVGKRVTKSTTIEETEGPSGVMLPTEPSPEK